MYTLCLRQCWGAKNCGLCCSLCPFCWSSSADAVASPPPSLPAPPLPRPTPSLQWCQAGAARVPAVGLCYDCCRRGADAAGSCAAVHFVVQLRQLKVRHRHVHAVDLSRMRLIDHLQLGQDGQHRRKVWLRVVWNRDSGLKTAVYLQAN